MEDEAPDHSLTRYLETTRGVLSYSAVADLVAEELLLLLDDIAAGVYSDEPLSHELLLAFHHRILVDIVPDLAGKWRTKDVAVGKHLPPPFYNVPTLIRGFALDLEAQIAWCSGNVDRQLETLAFIEGTVLSVHPFEDFNGRATRAFLTEAIQRFDLPPLELSVIRGTERFTEYTNALRAFDLGDPGLLRSFWVTRIESWSPED